MRGCVILYIVGVVISIIIFLFGSICTIGALYYKGVPSKINGLLGYRTRRSMTSETAWSEANKLSGKLAIKLGIIFLIFNLGVFLVCFLLKVGQESLLLAYIPLITFTVEIAIIIIKVENHLKNNLKIK